MLESKTLGRNPAHAGQVREGRVSDVVRMKVTLLEIVPPIWRRFQVPACFTLRRLHSVLQRVIGWKDVHPHRFRVGDAFFGRPSDAADPLKDSRWVTLQDLLSGGTRTFIYEYGLGGSWTHEVRIEALEAGNPKWAVCLAGERACPPEDFAGPDNYVDSVVASRDPYHPYSSGSRERLRPGFDPERFDLEEVNSALADPH
jgi:hypothetical protein